MLSKSDRIKAIREGGFVKRCHTKYLCREYNVAQHSFNMLGIIMTFHPRPSAQLMKAVVLHDVPERWTGDLPTPVKKISPGIKDEIYAFEKKIFAQMHPLIGLSDSEQDWLKAADMVELWQWCREELALGNSSVESMYQECQSIINKLAEAGRLPIALDEYLDEEVDCNHTFLSDMPEKVFNL